MEKKPVHGNCDEHHWPWLPCIESMRTIGNVKIFTCNNCLAVKVITQKTGWEVEEPVETIVDCPNSAYAY
jgi:hypothetical protein